MGKPAKEFGGYGFGTRAVHAGRNPDLSSVPITMAVTGEYGYCRDGNPTIDALEAAVASLEEAGQAVAFACGMSAITQLFYSLLKSGDRVVCDSAVYGLTRDFLGAAGLGRFGVACEFADFRDHAAFAAALAKPAVLAYCEPLTNPGLKVVDVEAVAGPVHAAGARLVADATFLSPALIRPLALGADYVIHTAPKYLGGHGDALGGIVLANSFELVEPLFDARHLTGGPISPFNAWLILRGLVTMQLRMRRHCETAMAVAEFLSGHPAVTDVRYPGLASDPGHAVAVSQWAGFGGLVGFTLPGGRKAQEAFKAGLKLCKPWFSLGDSETLVLCLDADPAAGIPEGAVRVSAGLEDAEDIIADLDRALAAVRGGSGA